MKKLDFNEQSQENGFKRNYNLDMDLIYWYFNTLYATDFYLNCSVH